MSGRPVSMSIIRAFVTIKRAMASANAQFSRSAASTVARADAIGLAADEVLSGDWDEQFGIDVFQTGSGTSTNMNVNEVLASLAERHLDGLGIHPNDHVNASQSTNDVFPTAIRIAVLSEIRDVLVPGLTVLHDSLIDRANEFADVVKAGRTHLMDASPITLGQEFGGYAAQIAEARQRLADTCVRVAAVPLGGTATGNGLNSPARVADIAIADIARATDLALYASANRFRFPSKPRCPRRAVRATTGHRNRNVQDCQRHSSPREWAAHRPRGDPAPGVAAGFRRSCLARSIRSCAKSSRRSQHKSSAMTRRSDSPAARERSR